MWIKCVSMAGGFFFFTSSSSCFSVFFPYSHQTEGSNANFWFHTKKFSNIDSLVAILKTYQSPSYHINDYYKWEHGHGQAFQKCAHNNNNMMEEEEEVIKWLPPESRSFHISGQ